jgi:CRP-like cAMP-binding protein
LLAAQTILANRPAENAVKGTVLLLRTVVADSILFIESGRVVLGVVGRDAAPGTVAHQVGVVVGPNWLEATAAVLNLPSAVDAVAQTDVQLRRLPLDEFKASLETCAPSVQSVLYGIASACREQTELTVNRLAKDAEGRCAEWLLNHVEIDDQGSLTVALKENKRALATELGIVPETLSRVLTHLRELGHISGKGRILVLKDPSSLRQLAGLNMPPRRP